MLDPQGYHGEVFSN